MKFVDANVSQTSGTASIHYVLMLDRSGSMSGNKWEDLMKAVQEFLSTLEQTKRNQKNSKITIIAYDNNAEVLCDCVEPGSHLVKQLKFTGGGTDFDKPLQQAQQKIEQYLIKFDKHVLCMMSDGQSSYPQQTIKSIKDNSNLMSKLKFIAIGYGNENFEELKRMANDLGGQMKTVIEPEELKNAFLKLIPNTYQ